MRPGEAEVLANEWRVISSYMTALEGKQWVGDRFVTLEQIATGREERRLRWRVGDRLFHVDGDEVLETTFSDRRAMRRRAIDARGRVVAEERILGLSP